MHHGLSLSSLLLHFTRIARKPAQEAEREVWKLSQGECMLRKERGTQRMCEESSYACRIIGDFLICVIRSAVLRCLAFACIVIMYRIDFAVPSVRKSRSRSPGREEHHAITLLALLA